MEDPDVIVVGGGPVGLHAALKAAVLNHSVLLLDKGAAFSRVQQAARIGNIPLAPGISGADLLRRRREDIAAFERLAERRLVVTRDDVEVFAARRADARFHVRYRPLDGGPEARASAPVLVLATGIVDRKPGIAAFGRVGHWTLPYVHRGEVGWCLLCEGWTLPGKRVAVVGWNPASAQIAVDSARHFGGDVTLLTTGERLADAGDGAKLAAGGVRLDERVLAGMEDADGRLRVRFADGHEEIFDKALLSLGWYKANNELAVMLGARTTEDGYVATDENSEAQAAGGGAIRGLYAVGDVRAGRWKQIVVGWGDAESAIIHAYAHRLPD